MVPRLFDKGILPCPHSPDFVPFAPPRPCDLALNPVSIRANSCLDSKSPVPAGLRGFRAFVVPFSFCILATTLPRSTRGFVTYRRFDTIFPSTRKTLPFTHSTQCLQRFNDLFKIAFFHPPPKSFFVIAQTLHFPQRQRRAMFIAWPP